MAAKLTRTITILLAAGAGWLATAGAASAAICAERVCARREPFVCKGKPGSCGFAQGRCTSWVTKRYYTMPGRTCTGNPTPVR